MCHQDNRAENYYIPLKLWFVRILQKHLFMDIRSQLVAYKFLVHLAGL